MYIYASYSKRKKSPFTSLLLRKSESLKKIDDHFSGLIWSIFNPKRFAPSIFSYNWNTMTWVESSLIRPTTCLFTSAPKIELRVGNIPLVFECDPVSGLLAGYKDEFFSWGFVLARKSEHYCLHAVFKLVSFSRTISSNKCPNSIILSRFSGVNPLKNARLIFNISDW